MAKHLQASIAELVGSHDAFNVKLTLPDVATLEFGGRYDNFHAMLWIPMHFIENEEHATETFGFKCDDAARGITEFIGACAHYDSRPDMVAYSTRGYDDASRGNAKRLDKEWQELLRVSILTTKRNSKADMQEYAESQKTHTCALKRYTMVKGFRI